MYVVEWRDRLNKPKVTLVAANTHGYALQAVEQTAPGQIVQKPTVRELYLGESDDHDSTFLFWTGGTEPDWDGSTVRS
ncbi:hypothetical protein AB0C10_15680 [Microbispora amethystogenes]|uniref:hypothetical protein n=1 Tax=Microbispora amethystogenes TaxID=1427754 RepID=UPI0033D14E3C